MTIDVADQVWDLDEWHDRNFSLSQNEEISSSDFDRFSLRHSV